MDNSTLPSHEPRFNFDPKAIGVITGGTGNKFDQQEQGTVHNQITNAAFEQSFEQSCFLPLQ